MRIQSVLFQFDVPDNDDILVPPRDYYLAHFLTTIDWP